ncbi:MAG: hypothetical protein GY737_30620 [Desulfobacteraceae bacterium]|nr:hypothetical protein [Desulfobacteraceae bacterium]
MTCIVIIVVIIVIAIIITSVAIVIVNNMNFGRKKQYKHHALFNSMTFCTKLE